MHSDAQEIRSLSWQNDLVVIIHRPSRPRWRLPPSRAIKPLSNCLSISIVHANQITQWKNQLLERAADAFDGSGSKEPPVDVKTLHAKIGELALENDFLEGALTKAGLLSAKR